MPAGFFGKPEHFFFSVKDTPGAVPMPLPPPPPPATGVAYCTATAPVARPGAAPARPPRPSPAQFRTFWALFLPFWLFLLLCTVLGHAIAAISPTLEVGNAIGPGIASWFSSFAGFYLPPRYIPAPYLWVYWLNPFRYAFESMILAQFERVPIACSAAPGGPSAAAYCPFKSGDEVIEDMGLLPWGYWLDQAILVAYMGAFGVVALLGLRFLRYGSR